jgi:isopentenyl diphosphate isomerase/L-lactate dehydrogenase-like FMN-dependent dehydrogenase
MNRKLILTILAFGLFSLPVYSQTKPEESSAAKQLVSQLKASLDAVNDPAVVKAHAKYVRNLYDAFIAEGFTKEDALELVKASLSGKK